MACSQTLLQHFEKCLGEWNLECYNKKIFTASVLCPHSLSSRSYLLPIVFEYRSGMWNHCLPDSPFCIHLHYTCHSHFSFYIWVFLPIPEFNVLCFLFLTELASYFYLITSFERCITDDKWIVNYIWKYISFLVLNYLLVEFGSWAISYFPPDLGHSSLLGMCLLLMRTPFSGNL